MSGIWKASIIVENIHQSDTCCEELGLRAYNMSTIMGSIVNTIWESLNYVITSRENESSPWPLISFTSQLQFETWNDKLRDLQFLTSLDNPWADATTKVFFGMRSWKNMLQHFQFHRQVWSFGQTHGETLCFSCCASLGGKRIRDHHLYLSLAEYIVKFRSAFTLSVAVVCGWM